MDLSSWLKALTLKKFPLLITIGIVVLLVGGYFLYSHFDKKLISAWELIPDDAIAVYEFDKCKECREPITKTSFWQLISSSSSFNNNRDSIRGRLERELFQIDPTHVALHVTKKDDYDFLYFFDGVTDKKIQDFIKLKSFKSSERKFNEITVYDIRFNKESFTWTKIENIWVGSFTPFLVEDVIRTYSDGGARFFDDIKSVKVFPLIKGDAGNLYLKLDHISDLLSVFVPKHGGPAVPIGKSTVLDIKYEDGKIFLNGFSNDSTEQSKYFFNLFKKQNPVPFHLKHFITNKTIAVYAYGISDGSQFNEALKKQQSRQVINDSLENIFKNSGLATGDLYKSIKDQFAILLTESSSKKGLYRHLLIGSSNVHQWLNAFKKIGEKNGTDEGFYETYAGYVISEIPVFHFPQKLLPGFVHSGFAQSYYTSIDNTIIISENLQELKSLLNDINNDDTWTKSVANNKFFGATLLESSISVYFNAPKVLSYTLTEMHPRWRNFINENKLLVKGLGMGSIQFSHLNSSFYTNIVIESKEGTLDLKSTPNKDRVVVNFESPIKSLHVVKSHVTKTDEILIQDSLNNLSLISSEGSVLWKVNVFENITGEVSQIDFFHNGKLQYFFSTESKIHVIDRLGNYVANYPITVPHSKVLFSSVVDYDNSKNYRFMAVDSAGAVWMYDKNGNALEGWRPNYLPGEPLVAPKHIRVKGKDYIIQVMKGGVVAVMSRKGEMLKKFPLKLDKKIKGDFSVDTENNERNTEITVVTEDGFKVVFNLEGKIIAKEPLLKTSIQSKFELVADKSFRNYIIVQQDPSKTIINDREGKSVIENESIGESKIIVDYYNFGSEQNFVSLTDETQVLTYVYDQTGALITDPPLESSGVVLRQKDQNELIIYSIQDRALMIERLEF